MSTPSRLGPPHPTLLLILAYLGFIGLGLPDAVLGVSWPTMRSSFDQSAGRVGLVVLAATVSYLVSSVSSGSVMARLGLGRMLTVSVGVLAAALALIGAAPNFTVVVAAGVVLGSGQAAIDAGLNAYAARNFSARHMSWLHASFSFGAAAGPLMVTGALSVGFSWRFGYAVIAVALAGLAVAFGFTAGTWRPDTGDPAGSHATGGTELAEPRWAAASATAPVVVASAPARATLRLPALWSSAAAFTLYSGVELGAGIWAYTLLTEGRGVAETTAGLAVATYWGALLVGRLVSGAVTEHLGLHRVLRTAVLGMTAGALLVALPAGGWTAMVGLGLLGFSAAPVFPVLMLTTESRVGTAHTDRTVGIQVGAAAFGAATLVAGMGALVERFGPNATGPSILALTVGLATLYLTRLRP